MDIPVKYEDVVAKMDAALRREALAKEESDEHLSVVIDQRSKIDSLQQRLTVAEQREVALEAALKFYADGDHLLLADADAWDTCSGEPVNFLHDEAGTASVEDGSIAKAALKPAAEQAKSCPNCKVCMGSPDFPENCLINGLKP